ncbi:MAG: putative toxin-antitoxin system toxin component, PIN family [Thermoanaerobaculia bacterium]
MRVFLDTNVLVSALTARGLSADVFRLILTEHELLTGEVNLVELRRVLRQKMRVPSRQLDAAERLLREQTIVPKPARPFDIDLRDPDDKWVIASAVAGAADLLVTGDKDLLSLADPPLPVLDPRSFWELVRQSR